jgi:hypothetical protein
MGGLVARDWHRSQGMHLEDLASPRPQPDVETGVPHLVTASVVGFAGQHIVEAPLLSPEFIPRHMHARLSGVLPEINDD